MRWLPKENSHKMENPTLSPSKKLPVKQKVEAILFAVGGRIALQDIIRLARSKEDLVREALQQLKGEYDGKETSLVLIEDGDIYKLAVRDHYLSVVKKIVTETEISKTVLETLAVIAFKYPIRQSDLIKIRTNKAYDHLKDLEGQGFISRKKHGRTNLIKLTEKFFQYFDLPEEKLKQHLSDFESIAQAIAKKEIELHERKEQQSKDLAQMQSQDERIKKEIENLDAPKDLVIPEKIGQLEIFEEKKEDDEKEKAELEVYEARQPSQEQQAQEPAEISSFESSSPNQEDNENQDGEDNGSKEPSSSQQGISTNPEMDVEIERKVQEFLNPPPKEEDGKKATDDGFKEALEEVKKNRREKKE